MKLIDAITADAKQTMRLVLDDGSKMDFTLAYKQNQQGWFFSLAYGSFVLTNRRLTNGPNLLRAFMKIIPFGIACMVQDGLEPIYTDDFTSGRVQLYVLSASDVEFAETVIAGYFNG